MDAGCVLACSHPLPRTVAILAAGTTRQLPRHRPQNPRQRLRHLQGQVPQLRE